MSFSVLDNAIAGDHDERMRDGGADHLLRVAERDDEATLFSISFKGFPRQPLPCGRPQETGKKLEALVLPIGVGGRCDLRHRRRVGIRFGRDIEIASEAYPYTASMT